VKTKSYLAVVLAFILLFVPSGDAPEPDWYPWGPEAFEKAQKEDKPIFLSVGYSTCHWCHVMEYESFNNPQVARLVKLTL